MTVITRSSSPPQARILLVGDNKSGLAARKAVLEELGHRCTAVVGGEDALEHSTAGKFDIVVTDFKMPKMDGVELIKRLRAVDPEIPTVMLSGYVEALGLNETNTGADVVVCKNANEVTNLIRAVNRILRKKVTRKPPATHRAALKAKRQGA